MGTQGGCSQGQSCWAHTVLCVQCLQLCELAFPFPGLSSLPSPHPQPAMHELL